METVYVLFINGKAFKTPSGVIASTSKEFLENQVDKIVSYKYLDLAKKDGYKYSSDLTMEQRKQYIDKVRSMLEIREFVSKSSYTKCTEVDKGERN